MRNVQRRDAHEMRRHTAVMAIHLHHMTEEIKQYAARDGFIADHGGYQATKKALAERQGKPPRIDLTAPSRAEVTPWHNPCQTFVGGADNTGRSGPQQHMLGYSRRAALQLQTDANVRARLSAQLQECRVRVPRQEDSSTPDLDHFERTVVPEALRNKYRMRLKSPAVRLRRRGGCCCPRPGWTIQTATTTTTTTTATTSTTTSTTTTRSSQISGLLPLPAHRRRRRARRW